MGTKVLVADDEKALLLLIAATFSGDDCIQLLTARDGDEALRMCRQELPDVVFLDVRMPKLDGLQVCRQLKQDPQTRHLHIVILTAMAQKTDIEQGTDAGADDYLTKPFSPSKLLEIVDAVHR